MKGKALVTIELPSIDQRIANQYSFFTIMPSGINNLVEYLEKYTKLTVKYVINKDILWDLRDILNQWNINEGEYNDTEF